MKLAGRRVIRLSAALIIGLFTIGFAAPAAGQDGNVAVAVPDGSKSIAPGARDAFDKAWQAYRNSDYGRARRLYLPACEGGMAEACYYLGQLHAYGQGGRVDYGFAAKYYALACDRRNEKACNDLAVLYLNGRGVAKDRNQAISFYRKSCNIEVALGCANLGFELARDLADDVPPLDPRRVEIARLSKAACNAHPYGCMRYGYLLSQGLGVAKDARAAVVFHEKGCEGDQSQACFNLALAYQQGKGLESDPARAFDYFARACGLDNGPGCDAAGLMEVRGAGTGKNEEAAAEKFSRGCNLGAAGACARAGYLYFPGTPLDDLVQTNDMLMRGCDLKDANSCLLMALSSIMTALDGDGSAARNWLVRARALNADAVLAADVERLIGMAGQRGQEDVRIAIPPGFEKQLFGG